MASPAAPGAHLRTPAEVGRGRTAEAGGCRCGHRGTRRAGPALGSAACLARAHALGVWDPPNPGTPQSRPKELLAGPAVLRVAACGFTAGGKWSAKGKELYWETGSGQEPSALGQPQER